MGGCCCSSRKAHLTGTPVYYYCPRPLEDHGSSTPLSGVASAFAAGLLVDLGLETSIPDTFHAPAPLPYDILLGRPQSTDSESLRERTSTSSFETLGTCEDLEEPNCIIQAGSMLHSPEKPDTLKKNVSKDLLAEEEEACPICLEEYDEENPRLTTKCDHHFHLSCLLEWMERSDSCPMCDQQVEYGRNLA